MNTQIDAVMFLTTGFEEIEALATLDILRRGGVSVFSVSIAGERLVTGSHDITVAADYTFEEFDCSSVSMLILPGGPGSDGCLKHDGVIELIRNFHAAGKYLAAICAAPTVLGRLGLLTGKAAVCFPSMEHLLSCGRVSNEPVCVDGNIITSMAAGTANHFALEIVSILRGTQKSEAVKQSIYMP